MTPAVSVVVITVLVLTAMGCPMVRPLLTLAVSAAVIIQRALIVQVFLTVIIRLMRAAYVVVIILLVQICVEYQMASTIA